MAVHIESILCRACGICAEKCPEEAISMYDVAVVDTERCSECGVCVELCPVDAITMNVHTKVKNFTFHTRPMISFRRGFNGRFAQERGRNMRSRRGGQYPVRQVEPEEVTNKVTLNYLRDQAKSLQKQLQDIRKRIENLRSNAYK